MVGICLSESMTDELLLLDLPYGRDGRFQGELLRKRTLKHFQPQADVADLATALRDSFAHPLEFPQLRQTCVSGDRVVIALDDDTPRADALIVMLWKELAAGGIQPEDLLIMQPGTWKRSSIIDPRSLLSKELKAKIGLKRHDPTDAASCGYLASTAAGDRIYLANEIIAADLVIPIGVSAFDPLLGYSGEASVLYPGFSDTAAMAKAIGSGHDELSSIDSRPLRQQAEEIGWLLGTQFVISLVPGRGQGVQAIFSGLSEAVAKAAQQKLESTCKFTVSERAELVLVAVEEGTRGQSWDQVAGAIDVARRIVQRDGRIVVLSQLKEARGAGLQILSQVRSPNDALKPIQKASPPDYRAATRIAKAADWANVYLLSELPATEIEDLFLVPLSSSQEVQKLLSRDDSTIVIESAQKVLATCE